MEMEHTEYCMAAFQECNLNSWRQSAVFYCDVISILLHPEISVLHGLLFVLIQAQGTSVTKPCLSVNVYSIFTSL
jgi:hypothetical protein